VIEFNYVPRGVLIAESSSAGEFHPHALTEPDVNLSIHPALIVQPLTASPYSLIPPISG
jgi:hypothetical protein